MSSITLRLNYLSTSDCTALQNHQGQVYKSENLGKYGIFCFNAESILELEIINELAAAKGVVASNTPSNLEGG